MQNLKDLAELYRDQGEYIQAGQFYQRALAVSEQELESQKPLVMSILESVALFLQQDRRKEEAQQILHRVQELRDAEG
jgi:tetratricopeptide (TPR) repeat protein